MACACVAFAQTSQAADKKKLTPSPAESFSPVAKYDLNKNGILEPNEIALIENVQRENLNAIEEALAYRRLVDELQLSQDEIASSVGKDRATVANYLRLLRLPAEVRNEVATGMLSMGHARAILALSDETAQRRVAGESSAGVSNRH